MRRSDWMLIVLGLEDSNLRDDGDTQILKDLFVSRKGFRLWIHAIVDLREKGREDCT